MTGMAVLIAGANGNLGQRIARAMHARGLRVRSGMRDPAKASAVLIAADPTTLNRVVQVIGERLTVAEIAAAFETATGRKLTLQSLGGIDDGYAELERLKRESGDPMQVLPLMYQLPMATARGALLRTENDRYPGITPRTLVEVFRSQHDDESRKG